jgi:hypothetical protein
MMRILLAAAGFGLAAGAHAQTPTLPDAIAAPGETVVLRLHAEGAQIYECRADAAGKLSWTFREPIATLIQDGKTVGRHYAGPRWELTDGSVIEGKVTASAPGARPTDIPLLKLAVSDRKGQGALTAVTTIQRIDTQGGQHDGTCLKAGAMRSVAYATEYVFLKK